MNIFTSTVKLERAGSTSGGPDNKDSGNHKQNSNVSADMVPSCFSR